MASFEFQQQKPSFCSLICSLLQNNLNWPNCSSGCEDPLCIQFLGSIWKWMETRNYHSGAELLFLTMDLTIATHWVVTLGAKNRCIWKLYALNAYGSHICGLWNKGVNHPCCTFVFGGDTEAKTEVQQRWLTPLFHNLCIYEPYAFNAYGFYICRSLPPVSRPVKGEKINRIFILNQEYRKSKNCRCPDCLCRPKFEHGHRLYRLTLQVAQEVHQLIPPAPHLQWGMDC
jgi:hypothetical protein